MNATIIAASIGLAGVIVGLVGRDVIMALLLARQKREQELADRSAAKNDANRELTRIYADPLLEATRSLRFRLREIIESGQTRYLLASAPRIPYLEYKRISTLYRVAALLGWIRAFRRERSYLVPNAAGSAEKTANPIDQIESALADGQHVEEQRLNELFKLWSVSENVMTDPKARARLASEIDAIRQNFLDRAGILSATSLDHAEQTGLVHECAKLISLRCNVDIPSALVDAHADAARIYLGIKEAYIYRDWQAAIGDFMIVEARGGNRRFDVIGFGEFESRYLQARGESAPVRDDRERRWFNRLEAIFLDLDMGKTGLFDARRQQVNNLYHGCISLENYLGQGDFR